MSLRLLAALLLPSAPSARAAAARVEVVPELGAPASAPSAASLGAVPLQLPQTALVAALSAPALSAPAVASAFAPAPLKPAAPAPVRSAAARPARVLVLKSLSAPALDVSRLGAGESSGAAEKDFNARAQLDSPAALVDGALRVPAANDNGEKRARLSLVHGSKAPLKRADSADPRAAALTLAPTARGLRALVEDGSTRLVTRTEGGRWIVSSRESLSAYPTPEEIDAASGTGGRHFVASRSGLVEWNPSAPKALAAGIAASAWKSAALRAPLLQPLLLSRSGVAAEKTSWEKAEAGGLLAGAQPLNERIVIEEVIPPLAAAEFDVVAAKLGRTVDDAYRAEVLGRTNGYRMYWHSPYTYKDHPDHTGIPDGHFSPKFGIRLMVKPDWRRLKDLPANFRPLFAHEYVHWLQNEGFVSRKYGSEIAAVAVEILRAVELIGVDAVRAGGAGTVNPGVLGSFETGRAWARGGFKSETAPYLKGSLAGAAYEAAQAAGRTEAAWEFLNLVIAGKGALEPADAWTRVVGAK